MGGLGHFLVLFYQAGSFVEFSKCLKILPGHEVLSHGPSDTTMEIVHNGFVKLVTAHAVVDVAKAH
jgi:hypothetical protein